MIGLESYNNFIDTHGLMFSKKSWFSEVRGFCLNFKEVDFFLFGGHFINKFQEITTFLLIDLLIS